MWVFEAESTVDQIVSNRLNKKVRAMETVLNDFGIEPLSLDEEDYVDNEAGLDFQDEDAIVKHLTGAK